MIEFLIQYLVPRRIKRLVLIASLIKLYTHPTERYLELVNLHLNLCRDIRLLDRMIHISTKISVPDKYIDLTQHKKVLANALLDLVPDYLYYADRDIMLYDVEQFIQFNTTYKELIV